MSVGLDRMVGYSPWSHESQTRLVTKQQVQILAEPIDKRKISILLKPLCLADIPRQVDNTRIPIKAASAD